MPMTTKLKSNENWIVPAAMNQTRTMIKNIAMKLAIEAAAAAATAIMFQTAHQIKNT